MAKILSACIVLFIALDIALVYDIESARKKRAPSERLNAVQEISETVKSRTNGDYSLIAKRNIFSFGDKALNAKSSPEMLTGVNSQFNLLGTIVGVEGYGLALLEDKSTQRAEFYAAGETANGAKIIKIMDESIIMEIDGEKKILSFDMNTNGDEEASGKKKIRKPKKTETAKKSSDPDTEAELRIEKKIRVRNIFSQLRLTPRQYEGQYNGFIVGSVPKWSLFEKAGLQKGDVVVAINDKDMLTANDISNSWRSLAEENTIWLDVLRGEDESKRVQIFLGKILPESDL